MKPNLTKQKLAAGEVVLGAMLGLGSPSIAELMAHAGYDALIVEMEHNAVEMTTVQHMLMGLQATSVTALVRVPSREQVFIQRALDLGAFGVLVPMIRSAADVEQIVAATRYPPAGSRSFGPLRAAHYSADNADYLRNANERMLVSCILETAEAVSALKEIVAVPGLDALVMGLWDLCLSLGLDPLQMPHPRIQQIIDDTVAAASAHGVAVGLSFSTHSELSELRSRGIRFCLGGSDYSMLTGASAQTVEWFRRS